MNEVNTTVVPQAEESGIIAKRPRGFAAMDKEKVREISSKGGKAAHLKGTAHQWNKEEAKVAGRKGGIAPHVRRGRTFIRPISPEVNDAAAEE